MPVMSGLEAAAQIAESGVGWRILLFTMHESDSLESEVRAVCALGLS